MREYKRCKFCSMEMDKASIKCPHCNKIQTGKFSFGDKSENLIVAILIIIAIIVGISRSSFNLDNSLNSIESSLANLEFFGDNFKDIQNEFKNMIAYFNDDQDYEDSTDEYYYEFYTEDLVNEFENDYDYAYDEYCNSTIKLNGYISDIVDDESGKYLYLNTYNDNYKTYIFIPKEDIDVVDELDDFESDDFISYIGRLYYDESSSNDDIHCFFICDGYFELDYE